MKSPETPTPDRIMQFAWGYAPTLIIEAAVHYHVFDLLEAGSLTLAQLASKAGASARGLKAILNALTGLELLARTEEGYGLTPESAAFLVSSRPGYRGRFFAHHSQQLLPQWQRLTEVVQTGKPVVRTDREANGAEHFARFVESLFPISYGAAQALGAHLNIPRARTPLSVLDIGAGSGVWGIALAEQSPQVTIRAIDWPAVLDITRKVAAQHGVAARLTGVPGDFLTADFGTGHRVAVLGHILHSEGPERCRQLLRRIWAALAPRGTLAIQEFVVDDDRRGPAQALMFAVNMLVNTEAGDAYSFAEMSAWLSETGYQNIRRLEVPSPSALVLADKPA